jgi:hypothetical protein
MWTIAKIYLGVIYRKAKGPVLEGLKWTACAVWLPIIDYNINVAVEPDMPWVLKFLLAFLVGVIGILISIGVTNISKALWALASTFWKSVKDDAFRVQAERREAERKRLDEIAKAKEKFETRNRLKAIAKDDLGLITDDSSEAEIDQAIPHARTYERQQTIASELRPAEVVAQNITQNILLDAERAQRARDRQARDKDMGTMKPIVTELPEETPEITHRPNRLESI